MEDKQYTFTSGELKEVIKLAKSVGTLEANPENMFIADSHGYRYLEKQREDLKSLCESKSTSNIVSGEVVEQVKTLTI